MKAEEILARLDAQGWRCCYPCEAPGVGGAIESGDEVALCFDGHGLCHARCASVGVAPERPAEASTTVERPAHGGYPGRVPVACRRQLSVSCATPSYCGLMGCQL